MEAMDLEAWLNEEASMAVLGALTVSLTYQRKAFDKSETSVARSFKTMANIRAAAMVPWQSIPTAPSAGPQHPLAALITWAASDCVMAAS